jgi:hypothetical protein
MKSIATEQRRQLEYALTCIPELPLCCVIYFRNSEYKSSYIVMYDDTICVALNRGMYK